MRQDERQHLQQSAHVVLFCTQTQQLRHGLDAAWFAGKRVSEEHGGFCLAF